MIVRTGHSTTAVPAQRGLVNRAFVAAMNYYVAMVIDLTAALAFLALGVRRFGGHPSLAIGVVVLGFMSFGFLEYAVHRWVLHGPPSIARRSHRHHHAEPAALIATPFFVVAIASLGVWQLLGLVCPPDFTAFFVFGLYAGYNHFALFHHWVHQHRSDVGCSSYWRRLDRLHRVHHLRQGGNFGVSMTMWDGIFGTLRPVTEPRKSSGSNRGPRAATASPLR